MTIEKAIRGERVKRLRVAQGMNQVELAAASSVGQSYISEIESGHRLSVGTVVIAGLSRALGTSTDYLVGVTNNPTPVDAPQGISAEDWALLRDVQSLGLDEQAMVRILIEALAKRQRPAE
jgi:transcriptional regulator with XRE-family HTH domain